MGKTNHSDHQTDGNILLERLASSALPASLKKFAAEFKKEHVALANASNAARTARGQRDDSLAAVSAADDELDAALGRLADKMAGAQMGSRQKPFGTYSKYSLTDLTKLAYANEAKEVLALVAKVKKAKPTGDVAKALATCEKKANAVNAALAKLTKPQAAYSKALAARDALLPTWTKSLNRLKKNAAAALFDDEGAYEALFAPPQAVQTPVHHKKHSTQPSPAAPTAPTNGTPSLTPAAPPKLTT
jgi:hypothetical protein